MALHLQIGKLCFEEERNTGDLNAGDLEETQGDREK